jgi:hypothetical protein
MDKRPPTLAELFPNLNSDELKEAEENLDQYLALVLRIFERNEFESNPQAAQLTPNEGTLPCTRSP